MRPSICALCTALIVFGGTSRAAVVDDQERRGYEQRIDALESRIERLEKAVAALSQARDMKADAPPRPQLVEASLTVPQKPAKAAFVRKPRYEPPPELVPEIGKIGAEVGLLLGGSANPFKLDKGGFAGGFIDLPLFDRPSWLHGKISYEISVGLSQSKTVFNTTSNVAQVANLTVLNTLNPSGGLQNVSQALTGTGSAPFPVTTSTETRLRLLQVVPFAFKYTSTALDHWRLRPYGVLGFGTYVTIHDQNPARGNPPTYGVRQDAQLPPAVLAAVNQFFGGQAPFGAALVAGQISQSPEVVARGLPGGNGNIDIGLHVGGGLAFRLTKDLSLGFDARYNKIAGSNGGFTTYGSRISLHF
jgi:hypothetical protein